MQFEEIKIDKDCGNQRVDRFLRKYLKKNKDIGLSLIYNWIRKGFVKLNGKKTKENNILKIGDIIKIPKETSNFNSKSEKNIKSDVFLSKITLEEIKKLIVYEDDDRIVWNKPVGTVIHRNKDTGNNPSMQEYLEKYCQFISLFSTDTFTPSFCFRLDKDTSGILISAKNYESLQGLNEIIRDRKIQKNYLTIVEGLFPKHKVCDFSLKKVVDKQFGRGKMVVDSKNGKQCLSEFRFLEKKTDEFLGVVSLLKVKIETGRMHQIRVHLANLGYPVIGDMIYGKPSTNRKFFKKYKLQRHLLHCHQYSFKRKDKQLTFDCEPSENIRKFR